MKFENDVIQRNFRKEDLEKIIQFRRKSFDLNYPGKKFNEHIFLKNLLRCVEKNPDWIQVLEKNGEVIGYIWFGLKKTYAGEKGEIYNLYIDENYRRKGLAKKLIKHAENYLSSKGIEFLELKVTETNLPAVKLYEKLNFKKTRIVMEKKL